MMLLVVCHLQNGIDGFLLGAFDKAAGIDDDDLRFLRILCDLIFILQHTQHDFRIHTILVTTETDQSDFIFSQISLLPVSLL